MKINREFAEAVASALSAKTGEAFTALPGFRLGPDFLPLYFPPYEGAAPEPQEAEERGIWMLCGPGVAVEVCDSREFAKRGRIAFSVELPRSPEGSSLYPSAVLAWRETRADDGTVAGDCSPERLASEIARRCLPAARDYTARAIARYQADRERADAEATTGRRLALAAGMSEAQAAKETDKAVPNYRPSLYLPVKDEGGYGSAEFGNGNIKLELSGMRLDKAERILAIFCS